MNWLGALTLISQRFSSGFDFLAKKLNIPFDKIDIYKAIIESDINTISSLFAGLMREIPTSLLMMLFKAMKGDANSIKELIQK